MKKLVKFDLFTFSAYCIVVGVTFGSAINFGFVFGSWFYPVLGQGTIPDQMVSWITGILLGFGAFGLFLRSELALKTILKIKSEAEKIIRAIGLVVLNLLFVGVGILGLFFRASFLTERGVGFLLWIGVAVEFFPLLIGVVLWPLQHPDAEVLEDSLMAEFERDTIEESFSALKSLPLPKRYAAYTGNIEEAFDEAVDNEERTPVRRRPLSSRRGSVSLAPTKVLGPF